MGTKVQVARSMVWTTLESFGVSGLSIIGLVVIAHCITPQELGIAAMALSIVQLLNIPVEFLFLDALIRKKDADELDYNSAHTVTVIMGLGISLLCWLCSGMVAHALSTPQMEPVLAWMGLSIAAMGFGAIITARQRKELEFKSLAIRSFSGRLVGVTVAIVMAVMGAGVWSLVAQQVLMVTCASAVLWLQSKHKPAFQFSYERFTALAKFGKNTVATVGIIYSIQRIFTLFVGASLSTTAAGYLSLAFRVVDILRDIVTNVVVQLALPMFSRTSEDKEKTKLIYTTATGFTCTITYPMFAGMALCAKEIITIVFGVQWIDASPYITLLALMTLVHFARLYSNSVLTAQGYPHLPIMPDVGSLIVIVIGMPLIGTKALGYAAAIWCLRIAASLPIDMYNIRKVLGLSAADQLRGAFIPMIGVCIMSAMVLIVQPALVNTGATLITQLITEVTLGALTYSVAIYILDKKRITEISQFALGAFSR